MGGYRFTNKFERAAFCERIAFRNWNKLYNPFKGWTIIETPIEGYDVYDILLHKYKDGIIVKRIYLEIKIRDVEYDEYFLETKKLNSIHKMCVDELYLKEDEYKIFYLNFTPSGTYLWDTKIVEDIPVTRQVMNEATMASRDKKINKGKYNLPISRAKHWEYTWDEKQLQAHYDEYILEKTKKKMGTSNGFNDLLFG